MKLIQPVTINPSEQPDIRPAASGTYVLFGNFHVSFSHDDNICTLRVPDGTKNDGASIPRWLWGMFGLKPDGLHRAAALVHDYLCASKGHFTDESFEGFGKDRLSSQETHELFSLLLQAASVPKFRATLMYKAVRVFGPRWKVRE